MLQPRGKEVEGVQVGVLAETRGTALTGLYRFREDRGVFSLLRQGNRDYFKNNTLLGRRDCGWPKEQT